MKKPWFHKQRGIWYLEHPNGRINLGKDKTQAHEEWHKLEAEQRRRSLADPTFSEIYRDYVTHAVNELKNGSLKKSTLKDYCHYADKFCEVHGRDLISDLKQMHLSDWLLANQQWGSSGQRAAIKAINRIINWAVGQGRTTKNPFKGFAKPPKQRHEAQVPDSTHQQIVNAARSGCSQPARPLSGMRLTYSPSKSPR